MGPIIGKEETIKEILKYFTKEEISCFLDGLKSIKDNSKKYNSRGICSSLYSIIGYKRTILKILFTSWQYYSGNRNFPVEGALEIYEANEDKWKGKYGWKRKRLLQHCINILTDALQSK